MSVVTKKTQLNLNHQVIVSSKLNYLLNRNNKRNKTDHESIKLMLNQLVLAVDKKLSSIDDDGKYSIWKDYGGHIIKNSHVIITISDLITDYHKKLNQHEMRQSLKYIANNMFSDVKNSEYHKLFDKNNCSAKCKNRFRMAKFEIDINASFINNYGTFTTIQSIGKIIHYVPRVYIKDDIFKFIPINCCLLASTK